MILLLDTCTFLWYISADDRLPHVVRDAIRSPGNEVLLSVVSFWEILLKNRLGRLVLPESPATYIPRQRKRHRIDSLDLTESAVSHLARLPDRHRDPFDRMLVCQAIEHGLTIVTPDESVRSYPVKTDWE
jgi:PIN domain nuclease of toxin-antitoxin system